MMGTTIARTSRRMETDSVYAKFTWFWTSFADSIVVFKCSPAYVSVEFKSFKSVLEQCNCKWYILWNQGAVQTDFERWRVHIPDSFLFINSFNSSVISILWNVEGFIGQWFEFFCFFFLPVENLWIMKKYHDCVLMFSTYYISLPDDTYVINKWGEVVWILFPVLSPAW